MHGKRAFTLIELLTVMAIIALLVGLLLPALATARAKALSTKDQSQIKQIHQSFSVFSRDYDGIFPTPGLVNRLKDTQLSKETPGRGPESLKANSSDSMYSLCVMNNLFSPDLLYCPTEPSAYIAIKSDYFFDGFKPLDDFYWDFHPLTEALPPGAPSGYIRFKTQVDKTKHGAAELISNSSYAHMPIVGQRKVKEWRDTVNSQWPILGNRGVRKGSELPEDYNKSVTLEFHGGRKTWDGNIGFNDNHVELLKTFYPPGLNYVNPQNNLTQPDNIFRNDTQSGDDAATTGFDAVLTLVSKINDTQANTMVSEWD